MPFLPLRLVPGADLRRTLEDIARREGGSSSFVVAGIGSLGGATLRLAGQDTPTVLAGDVEILCLSGTIGPDGAHLHMAVADAGGRVWGGHVCHGNVVRTTAEVLLAPLPDWTLGRAPDPGTGFAELVVTPRGGNRDGGSVN